MFLIATDWESKQFSAVLLLRTVLLVWMMGGRGGGQNTAVSFSDHWLCTEWTDDSPNFCCCPYNLDGLRGDWKKKGSPFAPIASRGSGRIAKEVKGQRKTAAHCPNCQRREWKKSQRSGRPKRKSSPLPQLPAEEVEEEPKKREAKKKSSPLPQLPAEGVEEYLKKWKAKEKEQPFAKRL